MTDKPEGLAGIIARLESCVDKLAGVDDRMGLEDAQAIVEALRQPPNEITLRLGSTPVSLPPWYGSHAWQAQAVWGPGDARHVCYGTTWSAALTELAQTLKLKEGDDEE